MLILLIGNIATGKTEFRKLNFINGEKIICPDEWIGLNMNEKNQKFISDLHKFLSERKVTVIDGNNINRKARKKYFQFAKLYNCSIEALDFGSGNNETLKRRLSDTKTEEHGVWIDSHNYYLRNYQKPVYEEGFDKIENKINYEENV